MPYGMAIRSARHVTPCPDVPLRPSALLGPAQEGGVGVLLESSRSLLCRIDPDQCLLATCSVPLRPRLCFYPPLSECLLVSPFLLSV